MCTTNVKNVPFTTLLVQSTGYGSGSWFTNNIPHNVQTGNNTSIPRCLPVGITEISCRVKKKITKFNLQPYYISIPNQISLELKNMITLPGIVTRASLIFFQKNASAVSFFIVRTMALISSGLKTLVYSSSILASM